jgi:hypothetical protein
MSTFDDFLHLAFIDFLSSPSISSLTTDLKKLYLDSIKKFTERWDARYNRQQTLFMSRVTAYIVVLREVLKDNGEINWNLLPEGFPVMGPKFIPPPLETLILQRKSVSFYYVKPFTIIDPQLYSPNLFKRKDLCIHANHLTGESIQRKELTLPRQCHGLRSMEYVIGVVNLCVRCKKNSTTSSGDFWTRMNIHETSGK